MIKINAYELKEYIVSNNKTLEVLEKIGCNNIKSFTKAYRCGTEKHENNTSVSISKETLSVRVYARDNKIKGDIFTLIMDIKEVTFSKSVQYVHKILGLTYTGISKPIDEKPKFDILKVFTRAIRNRFYVNDFQGLELIKEDITDEYIKCPYIEWIREGIMPYTQDVFGIGYSSKYNRVVIPHRYWSGGESDFVGVIGRTLIKNYEMFDIPKYFPLHAYSKSMNIYGLQENYQGIQKAGYVVVYESEKSPMKRHSRCDNTGVSLCGHEMSDEQAKILISLNVDIIIAMDKDIGLDHIKDMCSKFYGIRPVYYIYDELGLLDNKESPADKHEKIFKVLFNRKVRYEMEV